MADSLLQSLDLLDISSVTVPGSLFLYVVNDGNPRKISAQDMSASVLGGIKQYATKTKSKVDYTKNTFFSPPFNVTVNDTYGLVDANSATLFRIPDDTITYAQLICQGDWESYIGQNGGVNTKIVGGGLPDDTLTYDSVGTWDQNNLHRHQSITPRIRVQSGSYFSAEVLHSHSVSRQWPWFDNEYCFYSIWCW